MDKPISHAMSEDVICVKEDEDIEEVTRLMENNQVSRILVVDDNERPVGMVSLHDLTESQGDTENAEVLSKIKQ